MSARLRLLVAPWWVRRLVTVPLTFLLFVWVIGLLPLWLLVAGFVSRFVPGKWRVFRLAWFAVVYLVLEVVVLVALFALWLRAGAGRSLRSETSLDRHHRLMAWFLRRIVGTARFTFGLTFEHEDDRAVAPAPDRPVLVFSRHAGAGDSILLVDAIMNGPQPRRPRIVLKDVLQLDPAIDVLLNRIRASFVGGRPASEIVFEIEHLAATATERDALVLFPEGGNFTDERRTRAISKLETIGRPDLAERARRLEHLLPPRPSGALAAIAAAPTASVAFVGHVGLEALSTPRDIWRNLPMDHVISSRTWRVHAEDIPAADQREAWLFEQWETIDGWINTTLVEHEQRRAEAAASRAVVRPRRRYLQRLTMPISATACALALVMWWEALRPSLLPRSPVVQGAVGAICASIGVLVGSVITAIVHRVAMVKGRHIPPVWRERLVSVLFTVSLPVMVLGAWRWLRWQQDQRRSVLMPELGATAVVVMLLVTALLFLVLVALGRTVVHAVVGIDRLTARWIRASLARWVAVGLVIVIVSTGSTFAVGRFGGWADQQFGAFDTTTADGLDAPTSELVSGGPGSLVSWDDLGYEGRNFAGSTPTKAELAPTARPGVAAVDPVRVYVGLDSAGSVDERVQLAVAELDRVGAFDREVLVVVTPTGTGWIDPDAAQAIEHMYGGDTAIVGVQYSFLPSWIAFLLDTESPRQLGVALFDAVYEAWSARPADDRPALAFFGESLGSMGGEHAFARDDLSASIASMTERTDAMLLTGPTRDNPVFRQLVTGRDEGTPPWRPSVSGEPHVRVANGVADIAVDDQAWASPRILYLHHPSDAIGTWSFDNAVRSPGWSENPPPADIPRAARWTPLVSFAQESFDLMNGFSATPGYGHDYSVEFVDAWAAVLPPTGWTAADTAALRAALLG